MSKNKVKLLIDVGVGHKAEKWIKTQDFDVKVIRDIDPRMTDLDILNIAVSEKRLEITMDKDFGELVFKSKWPHAGVLLLRLDDERSEEKINVLKIIFRDYLPQITGKFSVYKDNKLRIRQ